jgi:beta-phosphoglucomutase
MTTYAFLFDLDGVVTDTAHLHFIAWRSLARSVGVQIDEHFNEQLKGVSRAESLERILALASCSYSDAEKAAMSERKNADYRRLIETMTPANLLPGALAALHAVRDAGHRLALASASRNANAVLERLGIRDLFEHVVDANTIERSKPDPAVFFAAADALGVAPADCFGVEDSLAGVQALRAAGMFAIGVGHASVLAGADQVVPDLRGFRPSNYVRPGWRLQWVSAA